MRTPRKVCAVTTSRADFGSLRWLMREIRSDASLRLQVVVSGMHLDPSHGGTVAEVEAAGSASMARWLLVGDEPGGHQVD